VVNLSDAATNPWLSPRLERKFYIMPHKVESAYGLLRLLCRADRAYPTEQINSLYFDTNDLDQYERSQAGDFIKDKVRLRWYGTEADLETMHTVFLELKSRKGFASTKHRLEMRVLAGRLSPVYLHQGVIPRSLFDDSLARFGYFPMEPLQPIVRISYWRYRYREVLTGTGVALDCHIRSTMVTGSTGNGEKDLELAGAVIEIKGQDMEIPPLLLKQLNLLETDWRRFSKYSACINAHKQRLGAVGRLSPSGINVDDIPNTLHRQGINANGPAGNPAG
jgi:hypothetical protein